MADAARWIFHLVAFATAPSIDSLAGLANSTRGPMMDIISSEPQKKQRPGNRPAMKPEPDSFNSTSKFRRQIPSSQPAISVKQSPWYLAAPWRAWTNIMTHHLHHRGGILKINSHVNHLCLYLCI